MLLAALTAKYFSYHIYQQQDFVLMFASTWINYHSKRKTK